MFNSSWVILWGLQRRTRECDVRVKPTGAAELSANMVCGGFEDQGWAPVRRKWVLYCERRMVWMGIMCGLLGAWGRPLRGNRVCRSSERDTWSWRRVLRFRESRERRAVRVCASLEIVRSARWGRWMNSASSEEGTPGVGGVKPSRRIDLRRGEFIKIW